MTMKTTGVVEAIPPKRGGVGLTERFWAKVNKDGPIPPDRPDLGNCWEWTARRHKQGYGMFAVNRVPNGAHRVAYELEVGPIPEGMRIDHICRNEPCVRPSHLRPVTAKQNGENQSVTGRSKSGVRGVTWHKHRKKWQAGCYSKGKFHYAGMYDTIAEAAEAVRLKRLELHTHNDTDRY